MDEEKKHLLKLIDSIEESAIDVSTYVKDSIASFEAYEAARAKLILEPLIYPVVPDWVIKNRTGSQLRMTMQVYSGHYADRRMFITNSVNELRYYVENGNVQPVALSFSEVKSAIKTASLESLWKKVHSRRESDPEGAITASRTLLEATLKHILEEVGETYGDKEDLPDLYKKVCQKLNLSPGSHNESIFKQILQGVSSVVYGFSTLRNKYGDAHGRGKKYLGPEKRHAELVVNLAGTTCVFLMDTLEVYLKGKK